MECAHLKNFNFMKPSPYVEISVDGENPRKTDTVKTTIQPKWNESFTLLVTLHSKINFAVLDRNSFRKDTTLGENKVDVFELLNNTNGRIDNLEITLDLINDNKQTETPSKCGELTCVLNGLNVDMSKFARTSQSSSMPLSPSNSYLQQQQQRTVLNGIRVKYRSQGAENMMPTSSSRPNSDRNVAGTAAAAAVLPISPSNNSIPNGMTISNKLVVIWFVNNMFLGNIGPPATVPNGNIIHSDGRNEEPLPPGWEMRLDTYGRRYYVDHNTKYVYFY